MRWKKLKPFIWRWRGIIFAVPRITVLVVILRLTGLLQALELTALDQFFLLRPPEPPDQRIVIVEINEEDIHKFSKWPISDADLASILEKIKQQQPRAIGLDIYRDLPVEPGYEKLVKVFANTPNLIGVQKLSKSFDSATVNPPPELQKRQQVGSNDLPLDDDGRVRRGLLYVNFNEDDVIESFALKLALLYLKPEKITDKPAANNPNYLQLGKAVFPIFESNNGGYVWADDGGYQVILNYRGRIKQQFATISLSQVQNNQIPPNFMRGKIVLIGSTAESLKDLFYTPYTSKIFASPERMAGVTIHANSISQILSAALEGRTLIKTLPESVELLSILLWSIIGASLCWQQRHQINQRTLLLVSVIVGGGMLVGGSFVAFLLGWWLPLIPSMLAWGGSAIAVTHYIAQSAGEMRQTLGRYLTDEVVVNLLETPSGLKIGGERRQVTLLFSDLRGFSAISEQLPPEKVVQILNLYLEVMTDIINKYHGTINEFMGDGIFIMFGAPISRYDDAQRAIACAVEMQLAMAQVNHQNQQMNLPKLEMGIGINTGEVVAGNIGSQKRAKYTVIGSHVNLAARIETYTVGGQILISENTYQDAQIELKIMGQLKIEPKGIKEIITIYDIVGIGGDYNLYLPEDNDLMVTLASPLTIEYTVLQGKQATGILLSGEFVTLSEKKALLKSTHPLEPLNNLKLRLVNATEADIYAKVITIADEHHFLIRFTNLPPQAIEIINSLLV
ncbi:CHASE2 domain-containing protein [Nostoc sp. CMAA1605]|uniref:CHASE2 domain-containing protein n=1 Tax=Nostoc sp. CMAA1605 TaxID=2055159 RepID=UPI001F17D683|nr:adenylate/guanylate cyclase domain-containing protein [Nostoc sp. CMAA1605]MCF4967217.1 adenylate/guanylate cyclase domain-containing protein [Nostoc sp. CMAA1605]